MARSIEILMAAHEGAQARRKKGLNPWKDDIRITPILESGRPAREKAAAIAKVLERKFKKNLEPTPERADQDYDPHLFDVVDNFKFYAEDTDEDPELELFDSYMDELYDWADLNRIWIA